MPVVVFIIAYVLGAALTGAVLAYLESCGRRFDDPPVFALVAAWPAVTIVALVAGPYFAVRHAMRRR